MYDEEPWSPVAMDAPLQPSGGSFCSRRKSRMRRFRAGVVILFERIPVKGKFLALVAVRRCCRYPPKNVTPPGSE